MFKGVPVVIVAALSREKRGIGMGGNLLWRIPDDLKRFKALTLGHPIIMGRRTFASIIEILGKPLPGRTNICLLYTSPSPRDRTRSRMPSSA